MLDAEIPEPPDVRRTGLRSTVFFGLLTIGAFFGGFGFWASFAQLESAAIAPGIVVVESSRKTVQHFEGGIVGGILVREGSMVHAGQPLIRLDQTRAKAAFEQLRTAYRSAAALAARLIAERDGRESITFPVWLESEKADERTAVVMQSQKNVFAARLRTYAGQSAILDQQIARYEEEIIGIEGQISAEERQLKLLSEEIAGKEKLLATGLIDKPQVLALKRRQAEIKGSRSHHAAAIARVHQIIGETNIRISELETQPVVRMPRVPDAVLAGVAVNDERAVRSRPTADDEVIAADALPAGAGEVEGGEREVRVPGRHQSGQQTERAADVAHRCVA